MGAAAAKARSCDTRPEGRRCQPRSLGPASRAVGARDGALTPPPPTVASCGAWGHPLLAHSRLPVVCSADTGVPSSGSTVGERHVWSEGPDPAGHPRARASAGGYRIDRGRCRPLPGGHDVARERQPDARTRGRVRRRISRIRCSSEASSRASPRSRRPSTQLRVAAA